MTTLFEFPVLLFIVSLFHIYTYLLGVQICIFLTQQLRQCLLYTSIIRKCK